MYKLFFQNADITAPCQYGSSLREDIMNVPRYRKNMSDPPQQGKVKSKYLYIRVYGIIKYLMHVVFKKTTSCIDNC